MMVGEQALFNYYKLAVDLMHKKLLSLTELENLIPFERDILIVLHNEASEKK